MPTPYSSAISQPLEILAGMLRRVRLAPDLPAVELVELAGGHFDAYEAEFAASSQAAVSWFGRFLMN